jgi:hypothetical protein
MRYNSRNSFFNQAASHLHPKGPFALIIVEDGVEVDATIAHCLKQGFREVIVFGAPDLLPIDDAQVHLVEHDMHATDALTSVVNAMIRAFPGVWMHYCYNGEFLYFPFCETRNIREMIDFNVEERRDTVLTYVIDLYSIDLGKHPNSVTMDAAHMDRSGYYALARSTENGQIKERQLDFFGGLRWRFEEHVPWTRRKIDRVSIFKAMKGLQLRENHTFNIEEYNTYSCEWHNSLSATICSFRTAKALLSNPGSMYDIPHFWWKNSEPFQWNSNQLLELGLMEPGQWF